MATFYGANATKRANQSIPDLEANGDKKSPLLVALDSYANTATKAQNDIIRMMKLPPKARIHDVVLSWDASLDASGGTLEVGWEASTNANTGATVDAADDDGFMDAVDVAAAAGCSIMTDDEGTRPGMFKQFGDAEVQVTLKVSHSGGLDATSGNIYLAVYYSIS